MWQSWSLLEPKGRASCTVTKRSEGNRTATEHSTAEGRLFRAPELPGFTGEQQFVFTKERFKVSKQNSNSSTGASRCSAADGPQLSGKPGSSADAPAKFVPPTRSAGTGRKTVQVSENTFRRVKAIAAENGVAVQVMLEAMLVFAIENLAEKTQHQDTKS